MREPGKSGPISHQGVSQLLKSCLVLCRQSEEPFPSTQVALLPNNLSFLEAPVGNKHTQISEELIQTMQRATELPKSIYHYVEINGNGEFGGHSCYCGPIVQCSHTVLE